MSKKQSSAAPRRHYNEQFEQFEQFKQEAIKLAFSGNRSVPDVSKPLGISADTRYRWKELT